MSRQNAEHRAVARKSTLVDQPATDVGRGRSEVESSATDDELVAAIRNADHDAFDLLYNRYFRRIYNFSFARLRNHADTEEVVQETFISVFKSITAYRGESLLVSWIYGIARNTVNNHLRRSKTQQQRLEEARLDLARTPGSLASCSPEEHLALQRCTDAIQEQLNTVGEWQAQVFVMRHIQNMPIAEIAKEMSRSSDSIRSSLYRVKRMLVEAVDPGFARAGTQAQHFSEVVA